MSRAGRDAVLHQASLQRCLCCLQGGMAALIVPVATEFKPHNPLTPVCTPVDALEHRQMVLENACSCFLLLLRPCWVLQLLVMPISCLILLLFLLLLGRQVVLLQLCLLL